MTLVTARESDGTGDLWDFADPASGLQLPPITDFVVSVDGTPTTVLELGYRRRVAFAERTQWDLRLQVSLFLRLATPIPLGASVSVTSGNAAIVPAGTSFNAVSAVDATNPAIHVNHEGYTPGFPKQAMVGYYLGSLGELPVTGAPSFDLRRADDLQIVYSGSLTSRSDFGFTITPTPYQDVLEADFSSFDQEGEYILTINGWGASLPFRIDSGTPALYSRAYSLGLYHQRSGTAKSLPYTRFTHGADHTAPAQIPTTAAEFSAANTFISQATADALNEPRHTAPRITDVDASLYPFVNSGTVDVAGGHFDAGDYSKYTPNSADMIHALTFAIDNFPGVASLDNLGIPESGDGIGDLIQELKWETDFLAKMQDADGGFYFLVYPKNRKYEDNVLPDQGDDQIVWPKNTIATAAATAALAEVGSSPAFQAAYPTEAANYLAKAQQGWTFLMNAIATHGYDGSYQKLTHYGAVFLHDDELAWAAAAMFAATGDVTYQNQLFAWFPDPNEKQTRRWTWWRLYGGYGAAVRTYAFAARSGRLTTADLAADYLAKCEEEIRLGGLDQAQRALDSAYGTSFPEESKRFHSAGWYFSASQAFDLVAAELVAPLPDHIEAIVSNLNYEMGLNPVNRPYISGLGIDPQTEVVNQIDMNHRRSLPPSGIPIGSLQTGFSWLGVYGAALGAPTYPTDGAASAPYPLYDRWGNVFNTTTEPVVTDMARSIGVAAWLMAQTSEATQAWTPTAASIQGLPANPAFGSTSTLTLTASGLDLSDARVFWETGEGHLVSSPSFDYLRNDPNPTWIEAEATLPDGRRVFAVAELPFTSAPPVVDAGDDIEITLPQSGAALAATIESTGTPSILWSLESGPTSISFDSDTAATTTAYVSVEGTYVLRLDVTADGFLSSDTLILTVNPQAEPGTGGIPLDPDADTIALYHFDGDGLDASGNNHHLTAHAGASFATDNLGWMASPAGGVARFGALGDTLTVSIPDSQVLPTVGQAITIDAWFFVRDFLAYGVTNAPIVSMTQGWDTSLEILDRKWDAPAVPQVRSGQTVVLNESQWQTSVQPYTWHRLSIQYDGIGTCDVYCDGALLVSTAINPNETRLNDWSVTLGNFDGDLDEVRISRAPRDPVEGLPSEEFAPDIDTIALYHFNDDTTDTSGNAYDLTLNGNAEISGDNVAWMQAPSGAALRVYDLGDTAQVSIPDSLLCPPGGAPFTIEARVFVRDYKAYANANAGVISLYQSWDTSVELLDRKWNSPGVPRVSSGQTVVMTPAQWQAAAPDLTWFSLKMVLTNANVLEVYIDDTLIQSAPVTLNQTRTNDWTLTLGNFDGDIDEVRVSSVAR